MRRTGTIRAAAGLMPGDHICWTYGSDAEHRRTLAAYLLEGLEAGQRLAYLAPERDLPIVAQALRAVGVDPEQLVASGGLLLASVEEVYLAGGAFDPDAQLAAFRGMVDDALAAGYSGLRACGECAGLLNDAAIREIWPAYELRADLMTTFIPLVGMCAYDRRIASGETLDLLHSVHPLHLAQGSTSEVLFHLFGSATGSLAVGGDIDFTCSDRVHAIVDPCVPEITDPCLDLSLLRFCDVAGVRSIARIARRMADVHDQVVVRGAPPSFLRIWSLAGFDRYAPVVMA